MNETLEKQIKDMKQHIHRVEDKLLRERDFNQQLRITVILQKLRIQLQRMEWDLYGRS